MKLHLVSLGCSKNLVDSEIMLGRLKRVGWQITPDPVKADMIIVNTCSFIKTAVNESIDMILELANFKKTGACRRLVVTGCLPERFREDIAQSFPEVDLFLGTGGYDKIESILKPSQDISGCILPDPDLIFPQGKDDPRVRSTPHIAYLKIAEGCNRHCTYCIIPKLRGKQKSRSLEDIVSEARSLISSGVKELILVAQETTAYGSDLSPTVDFAELLKQMSDHSDKIWVRVLYGHPESLSESAIETIAERRNICSYFDIPIQHVSNRVLKQMGRNYSRDTLNRLFDKIRSSDPGAALRTTLLVGFPGETDKDFETLLTFVQTICFQHLGVFIYSDMDDLPSHGLSDPVPETVAKERYEQIMAVQAGISLKNNQKQIGRTHQTLVEGRQDDHTFSGRTQFQAPEIDGVTYIHSSRLPVGSFTTVRIIGALEYDLIGETV